MRLMFRHSLQPKIFLKNAIAALLVITLSGAYCLFCCREINAATKAEQHPATISGGDHCHFQKDKSSATAETTTSVNAFECCGFKFNFFVAKLEKPEFTQPAPALANNYFSFLESVKPERNRKLKGFSYHAPVFESRDLHVKNCVFRI
jgi:hypothetical protein